MLLEYLCGLGIAKNAPYLPEDEPAWTLRSAATTQRQQRSSRQRQ